MIYVGSKKRIAKDILPIILQYRQTHPAYIEPFVGGANLIDKVNGFRFGIDVNKYLIALLRKLQTGWLPPKDISEEMYLHIKNNFEQYPDYLIGYVGFQLTYRASWFGSYRKDPKGKRNYDHEAYRSIKKQAPNLEGIIFRCMDYKRPILYKPCTIYCDPPYKKTRKYKENKEKFNHNNFWQWCRDKVVEGHKVFISELSAPDDFKCIWEKPMTYSIGMKKITEKLFIVKED